MTDSDEHLEIGRIVSEHKAAKRKYSCQLGKSELLSRRLSRLAEVFKTAGEGELPGRVGDDLVIPGLSRDAEEKKILVPTRDEIFDMLSEIAETRKDWERLDEQRKSLEID